MNLLILNEKDRKSLLKLVNEKDFKLAIKKEKLEKQALLAFKARLDLVNIGKIHTYVYENCLDQNNQIVSVYFKLLGGKVADKFGNAKTVAKIVGESKFSELTDEQKNKIEEYRKEYEEAELPISYDDFIKLNCIPDKESENQLIENAINKVTEENERIEAELNKIKVQLIDSKTEFNKLNSEKKRIEGENKALNKQITDLEKKYSVDKTITNIKKIIPEKFESKTFEDLLVELGDLETKYIDANKFDKALEVLGAKYALIKARKEEK